MQKTATKLSEWIKKAGNRDSVTSFCVNLGNKLRQCFPQEGKKFIKHKIWGFYHQLRTSEEFVKDWTQFLKASIHVAASPFFYQHVTDVMLSELIKFELAARSKETTQDEPRVELTRLEQNSLRYVCGYVCA